MVPGKVLAVGFLLAAAPAFAQQAEHAAPAKPAVKAGMTATQKIASAESAAPRTISAHATIMEMPATPGGEMKQLRAGTNGWVCYPNTTTSPKGNVDPMCIDKSWQNWAEAWMAKKAPTMTVNGIAYMLKGDNGASNTDPFAEKATPDNHWVVSPPHIMVVFADAKQLDGFSDDPKSGGPWVMWKGTPYAHLMVPVSPMLAAK
jgi:hypothetical protein